MNENHARHILTTFRHIENLLSETEHLLANAGSSSPFAEYTQDSSPVQRKVIHDYIERVHQAMRRAMADLSLPQPRPVCGALWAAQNHVNFAKIAVAEMEPKRLRGYGAVEESDAKAIDSIVAELNAALEQLSVYLAKGPDLDLQARLEKLEQTHDEVRLLRELERVITAHGLVEFRTTLALLLERLEHPTFEIGVFGRVSSGKSSLLNHLLGAEVLPVGVTPVTAIPTRLQFGPQPRATIRFAQSQPVQIEVAALAEYSTEQQNPGNSKHVAGIVVEIPSDRLREGITFVDTPGLGSLATAGAAETMAYLPRCDLGVVLIDAASTLTHEDLVIVQALCQSGAKTMVLVSKADLLKPKDRRGTLAYAREKFAAELGVQASVHPVSVMGADAALCDAWFETQLNPILKAHQEQMNASLRRKIVGLRDAVIRTFEARLQTSRDDTGTKSGENAVEAIATLRKADGIFELAETDAEELVEEVLQLPGAIINAAAGGLTAVWLSRPTEPTETVALVNRALQEVVQNQTAKVLDRLDGLRRELEQTLIQCQKALGKSEDDGEPLPKPAGLPFQNGAVVLDQTGLLSRPRMHIFGASFIKSQARRQLEDQLDRSLFEMLNDYRQRLRQWMHQQLAEMRTSFKERSAALRLRLESKTSSGTHEMDRASAVLDLARLRNH